MPKFAPPWESPQGCAGAPVAARPEFAAGYWSYALGRSPKTLGRRYTAACKVAAGEGWNPWWVRSLTDVGAVEAGCRFDEAAAWRVVSFFERLLVHTKGRWAGQPFFLTDWQCYDVVMRLFGWMRPDGTRRFRKGVVWTPKKNGKSGLASGLGLYLLCGDGEAGAEVYCAASARRQAGIVHGEARKMARRSPGLKKRLQVLDSVNKIRFPKRDGLFESVSSEAGVQEGLDWSGLLYDELHVADRVLVETLEEGGIARAQSLMMAISTAGIYDPNAVGWQWWQLCERILSGGLEDWSWFCVRYAAPEGAPPEDPETWKRANPSWGIILGEEGFSESWSRAKGSSASVATFRRYRLNQWVKTSHAWIAPARWEKLGISVKSTDRNVCVTASQTGMSASQTGMSVSPTLAGQACYGGLDLSSTTDLSAFGLYWPAAGERTRGHWRCWFWLPEDGIEELEHKAQAPYRQWAAEGRIILTPGDVIDHGLIRQKIKELAGLYDVREIAFDPWQATQIMVDLQEEDGIEMFRYSQGGQVMGPALKSAEVSIKKGTFTHEGCPVMGWMMAGAEVVTDSAGNMRLVKGDRKARRKLDGVVALVMALDRAARNEGGGKSRWEEEGAGMVVV